MNKQSLEQLQKWMKTVITTRGDLKGKLQTAFDKYALEIENVVESKRGVSAYQRMDIYAAGYVLRLLECMKGDYPGLTAFLGEAMFEMFAKAYIVSLPPESWSLFNLGRRFPQFLKDTKPGQSPDLSANADLLELPVTIAYFERAKTEVQFAKGMENIPERKLRIEVGDIDFLQNNPLIQTPPCLKLIQQDFPLVKFLKELAKGKQPDPPGRKTTLLAISRKNYRLQIVELELWQYVFLQNCSEPINIHQCAEKTARIIELKTKTILANLFVWLPLASESGLLVKG